MNKELFDEIEKLDNCLDYIEEFLKKYLCKNGCNKCPLNHQDEIFPRCILDKFIDDIAYLEDHINLNQMENEK